MKDSFKNRLTITFLFISLWFCIILVRSFQLQILKKNTLIDEAKKQIIRDSIVYPNRGRLFDTNGLPLAINVSRYSIFTISKLIHNKKKFAKQIVKIVPEINFNHLLKNIINRKNYTWIARKIKLSDEQIVKLKKMKHVFYNKVPKRIYPNNNLAAQIIGFVGMDNSGLSGFEFKFNNLLKGSPTRIRYIKDAKGRLAKLLVRETGKKGKDFYLTIDRELQFIAEKYLEEGIEKYQATSGGVGIIDAENGHILALADLPSFNLNKLNVALRKYWNSSFVTEPFEPGSIFKTLTIASALENKIVTPETGIYCEKGKYNIGSHVITEAESDHNFGWLSVQDILTYSSNIGTTKIAFDLTWPKLKDTLKLFRIGTKTNIAIPGESRGIVNLSKKPSPLKLSNISFGQGIATTPIQILAAYASIANGGIWNKPIIYKGEKPESVRIISKKTARQLTNMLTSVVEKGTGKTAKIKGFKIAGKTGTAQKSVNGKYSEYISTFIGFPTTTSHRYVILVYINNPTKGYYGSTVAAPVFRKMLQYIIYKEKKFHNNIESSMKSKKSIFSDVKFHAKKLKYSKGLVPNMRGFDKKTIEKFAKKHGLMISLKGRGISYKQSIKAGVKYSKKTITIYFKIPKF